MAGLTKARRAQREAPQATPAPPAPVDPGLVLMEKDGERLAVHPTCVHSHQLAKWKEVQHGTV
jgi:hypothetical protein